MAENKLEVTISDQTGRLDKVLSDTFESYTRSFFTKRIADGSVTVNGVIELSPKLKVSPGLKISVDIATKDVDGIIAQDIPLDIIYEDEDLLIVNKPQGMVVHPSAGHQQDTLVNALAFHTPLSTINGEFRPGIVHRIDKDTSGILMVAKNDNSHFSLADDLKNHKTNRHYLAIVHGVFEEQIGRIDAPIARDPKNRQKQAVVKEGREAITHFKVLEQFEQYALVSLELETGRTHQIRVHMAYIGHPVAGDPVYGFKKTLPGNGQYLHASTLEITHPKTKKTMIFEAPLPDYFEKQLKLLRTV